MNQSVALAVLVAFIISFSILSLGLFLYHYKLEDGTWVLSSDNILVKQRVFYSQKFPANQEKIFLIGSSQIWALNTIYMHEDLLKNNLNYTVYNLGVALDVPKVRMKTIDLIISAKPTVVVYGISDRDFATDSSSSDESQVNLLPSPHDIIQNWLGPQLANSPFDFNFLQSPKLNFLTMVGGLPGDNRFYANPDIYATLEQYNFPIANNTKLQIDYANFESILPLEKNENLIAFKKIISKLHENKIPVIIFVIPQERHRLEHLPDPNVFNLFLNNISQEYPDVPIYSLWDRYADMNIWEDRRHVVMNAKNTTRVYSDDVAKIITNYLSPNTIELDQSLSRWTFNDG